MSANEAVSFGEEIKPLFSERDRESMRGHFDLWSYEDVRDNAERILQVLRAGSPCDGSWPEEQVDLFEQWTASGLEA